MLLALSNCRSNVRVAQQYARTTQCTCSSTYVCAESNTCAQHARTYVRTALCTYKNSPYGQQYVQTENGTPVKSSSTYEQQDEARKSSTLAQQYVRTVHPNRSTYAHQKSRARRSTCHNSTHARMNSSTYARTAACAHRSTYL